ncbi:MAG: MATE family efflux transporter [Vallitaleaceae bacterium]|nr:MATE family efflux transporter [Vallitaleaceae bacterium]
MKTKKAIKKKQNSLIKGKLFPLYIHYFTTSVFGMLMVSIYILFDTIFIGQGLGSKGLAALSLLLPVFCLLYGSGMLFGMGGSALMSIYVGQGKFDRAKEVFTHAYFSMLFVGIVLSLLGVLFLEPLSYFLGADESTFLYVKEYLFFILSFGFTFVMVNGTTIFIRNDQAPRWAMAITLTSGFSNILLDYIFIFPLHMGMKGAALATAIASSTAFLLSLFYLRKKAKILRFSFQNFSWLLLKKIIQVGFSSFIVEVSSGIVIFSFNTIILLRMGTVGVSAYSILANIVLIVTAIFTGISQGIQPLLSQNHGANQHQRVLHTRRLAVFSACFIGFLFFLTGLFFPGEIIDLFSSDQGEFRQIAKEAMLFIFPSFMLSGINIVYGGYKQAINHASHSAWITFSRGVLLIIIGLLTLPLLFGNLGIWLTIPFAEVITLLLGIHLLRKKPQQLATEDHSNELI